MSDAVNGNQPGGTQRGERIEPLTLKTAPLIRLGWSSRFDHDELQQSLRDHPGLSLWVPQTGEYLIGGPWRFRDEIVAVQELSARANAVRLLDEFADSAGDAGKTLVLASEHQESRRREFYDAAGYELIEEIIIYELPRLRGVAPVQSGLRFERIDVTNTAVLPELIALDHEAFPWLWWNSPAEFVNYGHTHGVEIYLGREPGGRAVSYCGITHFRDWGHLDRIAVAPGLQGQRLGLTTLDWAVYLLSRAGAQRVALSTQARNERSRQLYERYGFRRTPMQDYALYGRWLAPAPQPK